MTLAKIYIVRHGNTFEEGEVVTRVGGRTDLPLSSSGRVQAQKLAAHFLAHGVAFTSARSGPLQRTRATAATILGAQAGAPELLTELFLREIDYGPDENRPEREVVARIGQAALEAWESQGIPPQGWRVDPAALVGNWQELFSDLKDEIGAHLVVTSNGIARFAQQAIGLARADGKLATGAYGILELSPDGAAGLTAWNVKP
jgi:broad specificity phosphatase PhoE